MIRGLLSTVATVLVEYVSQRLAINILYNEQVGVLSQFLDRPVEAMFAPSSQINAAINTACQQRNGQARRRLHPGARSPTRSPADVG